MSWPFLVVALIQRYILNSRYSSLPICSLYATDFNPVNSYDPDPEEAFKLVFSLTGRPKHKQQFVLVFYVYILINMLLSDFVLECLKDHI